MGITFRFFNLAEGECKIFYCIPAIIIGSFSNSRKREFGINFKFLFLHFRICIYWYKDTYVEDLRKDYAKLQEKVDSDTGVAI